MRSLVSCIMLIFVSLTFYSCGRTGITAPEVELEHVINFSDEQIPTDNGEYIYRQHIRLNSNGRSSYAYKITTMNNELPEGVFVDEQGWMYFANSSAPHGSPSLSEPGNHRTIWTSSPFLSIDFRSNECKLHNLISKVEVQIRTDDGKIVVHSASFTSDRLISSRLLVPFANGATTGTGIEFALREEISDIFVEGMFASHFMYRLNIIDSNLQCISEGTWYSSINLPNIRKVQLNSTTIPAITPNAANQFTQFECYVVSRQGVQEATHQFVFFRAASGYLPVAIIYPETVAGLGQNHYTNGNYDYVFSNEVIPSSSLHKNRRLWTTPNGYEAINSEDFKLYIRWGYNGQYAINTDFGQIFYNYPWGQEANHCLNQQNIYYGSSIVAFDLRFDNMPFPVQPHFINPTVVSHTDGSTWLRVNNLNDLARHHTFSNLSSSSHLLEVCAVDLQGAISLPATATINLHQPVSYNQRSGILIVDDTEHHQAYSPETSVDNFYNSIIPGYYGAVHTIDIISEPGIEECVSPTVMQNYKAVIWHNDNATRTGNIQFHADALEIYLARDGNLILSGTNKLLESFEYIKRLTPDFLSQRFGIPDLSMIEQLGSSVTNNPYFVHADGLNGLCDMYLELETPFSSQLLIRMGYGAVMYFNPVAGMNFLYALGCKPVDSPTYPPTQQQYDLYSSKYVAYKHSFANSSVVVFGFPLSYMEIDDVTMAIHTILAGILVPGKTLGGVK